ncbi:MAG: diadenylate cyclase, partial [Planctomycetota bacterium]
MPIDPRTLLQIVILSVGAHIVLSFLRTTRGTGMVRGVLIVLIVVFGLLLGLARSFALAELSFIVDALTGFVVVILAIVFQPELRRGIISLGDNPLLRTVIGAGGKDVVDEVAAACVTMAKRNQGALIAFERRVALDAWTQKAVRVDSRVNRHLLDNLFFPGSPLHDGAVIIREGRVAAAQAILPLSEKENLARSIGTRHRAALGLSEETDAVVVAVSEETGLITVCQDGQMERRVLKDELADDLRARLGREGASRRTPKGAAGPRTTLKPLLRGLGQKLFALVLGIGIFLLAHRSVQDTRTFTLRVAAEPQSLERSAPTGGTLSILLPSDDLHVAAPALGARVSLRVTAAQVELDALGAELGAFVRVDETWIGSERELRVDDLVVGGERASKNLEIEWTDGRPPRLIVERYAEAEVVPAVASFAIAAPENEGAALLPPRGLEIDAGSLEFDPPVARVRGPADQIAALGGPTARLPFAPVDLSRRSGPSFTMALSLSQEDGRDL